MFKKTILTVLAFSCAMTVGAASALAIGDSSGFGYSLFPNGTPAALKDPPAADAAALSAIEPAAGGGNLFSATLETERKTAPRTRAPGPDGQNAAIQKTRRRSGAVSH